MELLRELVDIVKIAYQTGISHNRECIFAYDEDLEVGIIKAINNAFSAIGLTLDEVAELAQAKHDGRLVVLPCNVGGTVYWISHFGTRLNQEEVTGINTSRFGLDLEILRDEGYTFRREFENVFLTREAAEKALKEREGNNQ